MEAEGISVSFREETMARKIKRREHSGPPWQPAALLLALFGLVLAVHGFSIASETPVVTKIPVEAPHHP